MKCSPQFLLALLFSLLLLLFVDLSYGCPVEPNSEEYEGMEWRLDPFLGSVFRYPVEDGYLYYAHAVKSHEANDIPCVESKFGGCKLVFIAPGYNEIHLVADTVKYVVQLQASMCKVGSGSNWESIVLTTYKD